MHGLLISITLLGFIALTLLIVVVVIASTYKPNPSSTPVESCFLPSKEFEVTSASQTLIIKHDLLANTPTIYLSNKNYTGSELAKEIEDELNNNNELGTLVKWTCKFDCTDCTFTLSSSEGQFKFLIDPAGANDLIGFTTLDTYATKWQGINVCV